LHSAQVSGLSAELSASSAPDTTDVLIIGAGPSGAVAAHTLATQGFAVICLEQGDWVMPEEFPGGKPEFELLMRSAWAWDPNTRRRAADYPVNVDNADIHPIMFNAVGGGSVVYGAHWLRLLPSDFRVRSLDGICDDWPIDHAELDPYYREVDEFIGVSGLGGDPAYPDQDFPLPPHPIGPGGVLAAAGMNKLGWHWWPGTHAIPTSSFKHMGQCVRWGVCERGCPAGAKASFDVGYWPHATSAGARLITSARVTKITMDRRQGLASGAIWLDQAGAEHRITANAVVLAANGIGTPRLLLMSDDVYPGGMANSSGLVGKNLMLHPNVDVTGLYDQDVQSWNGPAGQLLYSLQFYETDRSRGFYRGAKWNLMPIPGVLSVLQLFSDLPFDERWGGALHDLSRHAGHVLTWIANIEDLPEPTNTVTLDPQLRDSSGLPAPKVTYTLSENTTKNIEFQVKRMEEAHQATGAAKVFARPDWIFSPGHLLGTARMGNDSRSSVVDPFGRSHDISNLFIVDGSVMVTSGAVNPTATIAALALRSARHLADTARHQKVPA
jgi:choline dehydrogenase-like flavoprotein